MKIWRGAAATLEEAVWQGLKELGLPREKVEVKVLEDRASGLLSMMAFRRVRVELREKGGQADGPRMRSREDPAPQDRSRVRREGRDNGRQRGQGQMPPSHMPKQSQPQPQGTPGPQRDRFPQENRLPRDASRRSQFSAPRQGPGAETSRPAEPPAKPRPADAPEALLNEWKSLLGWEDMSWALGPDDGRTRPVILRAAQAVRLTEGNGQGLEAFEHVFNLIMQRQGTGPRYVFEVEGAANPRKQQVVEQARAAAEEVRRTGRPYRLDPMEPADRRLVHQILTDDPDVETVSEGEGPWRKVVIKPKQK